MITLITAFFVISPMVILYTAGYRYDAQTNSILTTGVISIDVTPDDNVAVYLDDTLLTERMPIRRTSLAPNRSYTVRLEADNHYAWEKDVLVEENQTAYVSDFHLIYKGDQAVDNVEPNVWLSRYGPHMIEQVNDQLHFTNVRTQSKQILPIVSDAMLTDIRFAPNGVHAFLFFELDIQEKRIMIVTLDDVSKQQSVSISDLALIQPVHDTNSLFIRDEGAQVMELSGNGYGRVEETTSSQWIVDNNGAVWSVDGSTLARGDQKRTLPSSPESILSIDYPIIFTRGKTLTLVGGEHMQPERLDYTSWTRQDDGSLLIWSPWEIWEIRNGKLTLLNRTADRLQRVHVADDFGALILVYEEHIEFFYPNYFIDQEIFRADSIKQTYVDREYGILHAIASKDGAVKRFTIPYRIRE